jgi:hypothetical protein
MIVGLNENEMSIFTGLTEAGIDETAALLHVMSVSEIVEYVDMPDSEEEIDEEEEDIYENQESVADASN